MGLIMKHFGATADGNEVKKALTEHVNSIRDIQLFEGSGSFFNSTAP